MKKNKINIITDFSYLIFILLLFITVAFIAMDTNFFHINIVILSLVSLVMILTYFTNLIVGLSLAALLIFIGIATMIYLGLQKGYPVPNLLYFWCIILPTYTICVGYLTKNSSRLQNQVTQLEKNIAELVTIDELTGLKNQKQFISDTDAYMHIATRYKMKLALMVAELRYQDDVERIVGKQNMNEIILHVSQALTQSMRSEDLVYIVDTERYCFAVLMMTNDYDGIHVAANRTKKRIAEINLNDIVRFANVDLNMRMGYATMEKEYDTALDFLNAAKHELEFDV